MKLAGQARGSQHGYAMAALLVAMAVMAIMMTMAMPVWKRAAQREKEEELVFRGLQYTHAIGLFQRKYANAFPPNLDVLVEQRFLRRKYKDPITGEDFQPVVAGQGAPGATQPGGQPQTPSGAGGRGGASAGTPRGLSPVTQPTTGGGFSPIGTPGAGPVGGIMGVASKSKEKSIRLYNGRSHYNEWAFVYTPPVQAPGAAVPGMVPGQRGQPGQRGMPGTSPFPGRGTTPDGRGRGGPPGRGFGPGGSNPSSPFGPAQPIFPPGRGRSGG